ncbi:hypothetical protein FRZ67_09145 [Panacibacter ginsenosidivorans]|uniref:T9SS type A sorting domain-containing protein n=1 Tax=Panacibacter ginsenosidivorans TaxID=1813871 RepID=A0A5B8V958_9BACT|nr:hypothetical protein [Panacibacter ginsenosidivorans]QEC67453.1 hypothetical protein FRZ67_09145 [Panacibacter ginsenosidivorans]
MLRLSKLISALLLLQLNVTAQWTKTAGPPGMSVNCFYGVGNTLFAGCSAKAVFRSVDNGVNWQASNTGIENLSVFSLIAKSGFLFAGTTDGVYRSADNGATWQPFNTNLSGKFVQTLYVSNGFIYVGTTGQGLFKSNDNGSTWTDASGGALGSSTIHAVTFSSPNLVVVADNLIFYSIDNGDSWFYEPTSPVLLVGESSFLTNRDSILLVAGRGIYRSFDAGVHWGNFIPVIPSAKQANINGLIRVSNTIAAGSKVGIFYSTDFGVSWKTITANGLRNGSWFTHQFYNYGNTLLLGYDEIGIAYSNDKGKNWNYTLNGFTPTASIDNAMTSSGNAVLTGTHGDGVYASSNAGNSWSRIGTASNADTLSNSNVFATLVVNGNILLAGTCGNGLYRSTNNGATWTRIRNGLSQTSGFLCIQSLAKTTDNILMGTDKGLYYSTDLGLSWNASNITGTGFNIEGIAANGAVACAASESIILNNKIYRSTNNGVTWTSVFETSASDFACMASDGANHFYAGTLNSGNLVSNNNGASWQNVGSGIPNGSGGFTIGVLRNNVFIGNNTGVYFSNNNGLSFTQQNTGFDPAPNNVVQGLTFTATDVYAGLFGNSVWRRPLADFGISTLPTTENKSELKISVTPNPVTGQSVLRYHLVNAGNVIINVYRADGSLVQNLLNNMQQSGDHETYISKNKLHPGNYYVVVVTGNSHASVIFTVE